MSPVPRSQESSPACSQCGWTVVPCWTTWDAASSPACHPEHAPASFAYSPSHDQTPVIVRHQVPYFLQKEFLCEEMFYTHPAGKSNPRKFEIKITQTASSEMCGTAALGCAGIQSPCRKAARESLT